MPAQRPLLPLLVILYQTAQEHPLGAAVGVFDAALNQEQANEGQLPVPRPTQVVALRQAVALGVLRAEGEKRGRRYFSGMENPGGWSEEELAQRLNALQGEDAPQEHKRADGGTLATPKAKGKRGPKGGVNPTPKATSGQSKAKKAAVAPATPLPMHIQQYRQLQAVVWNIADTLRDKSGLQVDGYRPVTLVLLALKRNLDTLARLQLPGGWIQTEMAKQASMLDTGLMTGADFARSVNARTEIFDPSIFAASSPKWNKACAALMRWDDLLTFPETVSSKRNQAITLDLAANPAGKSWFTYTTEAGDLKTLMEELVNLHVADLREAFGAIGLHAALVPADPHAPRLTTEVLRKLVTDLASIDLSLDAIPGDVFSDVYMDLLGRFAADSGKKGGDFFTPTPLVKGGLRLLPIDRMARELSENPNKRIVIADPTAGAFTFLTQAYDAIQASAQAQGLGDLDRRQFIFHAQELTPIQAGLGVFNFFFHGLASRLAPINSLEEANGRSLAAGGAVGRIVGNTISDYTSKLGHQSGKIDLVLANPPYGTADYGLEYAENPKTGDGRWHVGKPTRSEGEWAFVNTVVDLLSPTGKALIVLPLGVLFRDGGKAFRQYLAEKNWIEGIVSLPANQFLTTQIPVCMLLLNKDTEHDFWGNPRKHGVFMVNAADDFTKTGKLNHWDQDDAVEFWRAREDKPGYGGFVPIETLRSERNDFNLSINRYFAAIKEKVILDPVALAGDVRAIQARLSKRAEWIDGKPGGDGGLWAQAVAASAVSATPPIAIGTGEVS